MGRFHSPYRMHVCLNMLALLLGPVVLSKCRDCVTCEAHIQCRHACLYQFQHVGCPYAEACNTDAIINCDMHIHTLCATYNRPQTSVLRMHCEGHLAQHAVRSNCLSYTKPLGKKSFCLVALQTHSKHQAPSNSQAWPCFCHEQACACPLPHTHCAPTFQDFRPATLKTSVHFAGFHLVRRRWQGGFCQQPGALFGFGKKIRWNHPSRSHPPFHQK